MKLGLIGYGAMGQTVNARARDKGHELALVVTSRDATLDVEELSERVGGLDAVIDFSVAGAVLKNIEACVRAGVPLVEGTTGWKGQEADARLIVEKEGGALIYGANFSIGINLFYRVIACAAELFQGLDDYDPFIEEAHHARKRDAPSGTAHRLRDILNLHLQREIPVASTRAGHIPGTHRVGFDSAADQVMLTHTARNREGFAGGALAAACWIVGHQGMFEFSEVIDQVLSSERRKQ
jgi:4-hydroxy-tetrahydrodipicolinate reductase